MAHALPNGSASHPSRLSEAVDKILKSKASLPSALALLLAVLLLFAYEVRGYLNADCYAAMHAAALDQETAELFDDVGDVVVGLRKGTSTASKWGNREFQGQMREAQAVLADGRHALKERDAFGALDAIVELEKSLAQAKALATNRVNDILARQDPSDYDAAERYRLEGKNLVAIVKSLDSALETLDNRTKELPRACTW